MIHSTEEAANINFSPGGKFLEPTFTYQIDTVVCIIYNIINYYCWLLLIIIHSYYHTMCLYRTPKTITTSTSTVLIWLHHRNCRILINIIILVISILILPRTCATLASITQDVHGSFHNVKIRTELIMMGIRKNTKIIIMLCSSGGLLYIYMCILYVYTFLEVEKSHIIYISAIISNFICLWYIHLFLHGP